MNVHRVLCVFVLFYSLYGTEFGVSISDWHELFAFHMNGVCLEYTYADQLAQQKCVCMFVVEATKPNDLTSSCMI